MGIISFFKRLFSKDIVFKGDGKSHLVYVYKAKKGRIWFDKSISVPENMEFYFAKNGAVLDGFIKGEHDISPMYLSKTIKALKLNKKTKKGKDLDYFVADGYYISFLQTDAKNWKLFAKAEFFDEKFGYFKAMLEGKYIAKVTNAKQFLKRLLTVYDYLKQGEAEDILEGFISETVFKAIMKKNANFEFLQDKEKVTDFLFEKITKSFEKSGIDILGFSVEKITFSKNLQKTMKRLENQENVQEKLQEKMEKLEEGLQEELLLQEQKLSLIEKEEEILKQEKGKLFIEDKTSKQDLPIIKKELVAKQSIFADEAEILSQEHVEIAPKMSKQEIREKLLLGDETNFHFEESYTNKIDKKLESAYTNLKVEKPNIPSVVYVKCAICGENNTKENKNCVLCGEKL